MQQQIQTRIITFIPGISLKLIMPDVERGVAHLTAPGE